MKIKDSKQLGMVAVGFIVPMLAARMTRSFARKGYSIITHDKVPRNPAHPRVDWSDALIWAVLSGAVAGVSRMVALRMLSGTVIPAEGDDMEEEINEIDGLEDVEID
ncbi:DUF4235 domain-containing protein [Luteolibacter sp. AS25]|uniref:DUF4235 domain-containing protein n=1 Tax=Luteolibacter sp. AS25 TaxID=3135776 RepID=UPI00398B606A